MTLEQAKKASDILQKIDKNNEIIHRLSSYRTHHISFGAGNNEYDLIVINRDFVNNVVIYSIRILEQEVCELNEKLNLL